MNKKVMRIFQNVIYAGGFLFDWENDLILTGDQSYAQMARHISANQYKRPLVVTDKGVVENGLTKKLERALKDNQLDYVMYSGTKVNPPIEVIHQASQFYKENDCDCLIGIGGGSVIDTLKAVGVEVSHQGDSISKFRGVLKLKHQPPFMVAIPTTSGTGSEATLATVVSESNTKQKYAVMDYRLFPDIALLDTELSQKLPQLLTAQTGMDALTHAIEAYTNLKTTDRTNYWAEQTVQRVDRYLKRAFDNPDDLVAREGMLVAAFDGGRAFTRAYVGNVHAISHALTAYYGTPHGYANALVLPHVLKYYGTSVYQPLAKLSDLIGLNSLETVSNQVKTERFIRYIEDLNDYFGIEYHLDKIEESDFKDLARQAYQEANPLYPVPKIFEIEDFVEVIRQVKGV